MDDDRSTGLDATTSEVDADVRAWLADNWDPDLTVRQWWRLATDAGWQFPTWPIGMGGRNLPAWSTRLVAQAFVDAGALGSPHGLGQVMGGPVLLQMGAPDQQERLVPPLASGEESWCQFFSEPEAGSDLAGLRTRAERDGERVATVDVDTVDHDGLIELMIGHRIERRHQSERAVHDQPGGLVVRGLVGGTVGGVDLHVEPGEVVGIAGITGSGRELLVPLVTGQIPSAAGTVQVDGRALPNYAPRAAIAAGMAFVPSDRAELGVIPLQSVRTNLTLADVGRNWRGGRLRHDDEIAEAEEWVDRLGVKTTGTEVPIAVLSGGNQQKVLFGRGLRLDPHVLVLDEPTQGIDVGAKEEILDLVDAAAASGSAVLVASTDTDELVRLAHRVVVMRNGRIVEELAGDDMTLERIERAQLQAQEDAA